jgi:hypothetical protein
VALEGAGLGALEQEGAAVGGEREVGDLPVAAGQRPRLGLLVREVERVEVHVAGALGEHEGAAPVGVQPQLVATEEEAQPGRVAVVEQHPRLTACEVEADHPALLVVRRPHVGDHVGTVGADQRHPPLDQALGLRRVLLRGVLRVGGNRLGRRKLCRERRRDPGRLLLVQVEDHDALPVLGVAHLGARRHRFGVAGLGDVARHVGHLAVAALLDQEQRVAVAGDEHGVGDRLLRQEVDPRQRPRLLLGLALLAPALRLGHPLQQLRLLVADEALAVGELRLLLLRPGFGELDEAGGALERQQVEAAAAHEGDGAAAAREAGVALGLRGAGQLAALAAHGVEQDHVAVVDPQHATPRAVPLPAHRRRLPAFRLAEPARCATRAGDDPGRGLVFARLLPLEVEPLRVARPAQARGLVADQLRPPHDRVDAQRERLGATGARGEEEQRRQGERRPRGSDHGHLVALRLRRAEPPRSGAKSAV